MKDSYSFDRDEAGLDASFRAHEARLPPDLPALRDRVLRRAGRVGDDGRQRVGRLPRAVGLGREHARHLRERRLRGRPRGRPRRAARRRSSRRALDAPEEVETPGDRRRSRRSPSSSASTSAATSKAMPMTKDDGTVVLALVRGDDRLEVAKLAAALRRGRAAGDRGRDPRRVRRRPRLARPGRLRRRDRRRRDAARGPVRRRREPHRLASPRRRARPRLRGALRRPARADGGRPLHPTCGGALRFQTAIEVGHIFKLGTALLRAARRDVPRRGRHGEAARDGQLRHRPGPDHGRRRRAAPRRARDLLAGRASRRTTCTWSCCPGVEEQAEEAARGARRGGRRRPARRPRPARGREVRRRRPDRAPDRASPWARRRSRTAWSTCATARTRRRAACRALPSWARRSEWQSDASSARSRSGRRSSG